MGIIVLILFSADLISEIHMPLWVILAAASAMSLGTFFGGYKVIKTLGLRITRLKPYQGFAAETGGGIMLAAYIRNPCKYNSCNYWQCYGGWRSAKNTCSPLES